MCTMLMSKLSALKRRKLMSETEQNKGLISHNEVLYPMHTVHAKPVQEFEVAPQPYTPITLYGVIRGVCAWQQAAR
jgi:hypothetical protein